MIDFENRRIFLGFFLLFLSSSASLAADTFEKNRNTQVLGRDFGASFSIGLIDGTPGTRTDTTLTLLGKPLRALQATITPATTIDSTSSTEVYSFGLRVFSQSAYFNHDGILGVEAGLVPTEMRVPFINYPVGPLTLRIDGGVRFQASLREQINPTVVIGNNSLSSIGVQLQANAAGTGFIEAYAKLLVLRGGVGGSVDVIDGQGQLQGQFFFDGSEPTLSISGMVEFFKGGFYSFVDYFDVFRFGWTRFWTRTLYSWKGECFSTGSLSCPSR